jgi:YD repeat-containing protein
MISSCFSFRDCPGPDFCYEPTIPEVPTEDNCFDALVATAEENAQMRYEAYLDETREDFLDRYLTHCFENVTETFNMTYDEKEYHYTLYYYDQAGNLTKTVPPEGVDILTGTDLANVQDYRDGTSGTPQYPSHRLITDYRYNTLNQPVQQHTPDGGKTRFWYDMLGRLVLSQNAKQEPDDLYSYTVYDPLGRIIEVGQLYRTSAPAASDLSGIGAYLTYVYFGSTRTEVTKTYYDNRPYATSGIIAQDNLRNRVATITYQDTDEMHTTDAGDYYYRVLIDATYDNAIHYSYDIHGNVKLMQYDVPMLADVGQRFKQTQYEYDLASGKVNKVSYQSGEADQFFHRYFYDADNRVTQAQTSSDGHFWDNERIMPTPFTAGQKA